LVEKTSVEERLADVIRGLCKDGHS
jgi:hypothetical protein